jgi:hypothetical protein
MSRVRLSIYQIIVCLLILSQIAACAKTAGNHTPTRTILATVSSHVVAEVSGGDENVVITFLGQEMSVSVMNH